MGDSYRSRLASNADHVLGQAQDRGTLAVVTVATCPAPDYKDGRGVCKPVAIQVTGDMADPNVSAPAVATTVLSTRVGRVAFHAVLPATGTADAEVWVEGGTDVGEGAVGWLRVLSITGLVSRHEYIVDVGQRQAIVRLHNTANINGGAPATLRMTGVV